MLFRSLFGRDNINSLSKARREALELLDFVGLAEKADTLARNLTLIDKKRLELARALANNPEILLLDEVLAGLNPTEISEALKAIKKINEEMGVTIFMIEHVMKAIMSISQRIIVLNYGRKIAEGSPKEVARNESVIQAYIGEKLKI